MTNLQKILQKPTQNNLKAHPSGALFLSKIMKHLVITLGDPLGIGPEVTKKALKALKKQKNTKITLIPCEGCVYDRTCSTFSFQDGQGRSSCFL